MKTMKRLAALFLGLTLTLSLAACGGDAAGDAGTDHAAHDSGDAAGKYLIGISQYGEHGSLDNCRTGFLQGLEAAGLKEGVDYEIQDRESGV